MLELWYDSEKDEYKLKENGYEEKLSRMSGDFLRECAINNDRLQAENNQLRAKVLKLGNLLNSLGVADYDF